MQLTFEQIAAVKEGDPVRIVNSEVGVDCVVLRADVYERVKSLLNEDSDVSPREAYATVLKALDANENSVEQYLEYLDD